MSNMRYFYTDVDEKQHILATHVFGNPCNIEKIEAISKKYKIKVIYDAAHCFGVEYKDRSIFEYGDISTCSFHATKVFHTGEGGAVFSSDKVLFNKIYNGHNFGHNGPEDFHGLGINAKLSELQAAMGLSVLPYMKSIFAFRKKVVDFYDLNLTFLNFSKIKIRENTQWNYSYYPIIFNSEDHLLNVKDELNRKSIFPRRYFYPSLNKLPYVEYKSMPNSEDISSKILCLPLFYGLEDSILNVIVKILNKHSY